jgi:AcrR family transcriptional regulator
VTIKDNKDPVRGRPAGVVEAALALLDEEGWDAVTLRAVSRRLGVRLNTVSWHVKSKARLRELMADAIIAGVSLDSLPAGWRERATVLSGRYRAALLARRDGARLVAGTFTAEPATLRVAEALSRALLDGGLPVRAAGWAAGPLSTSSSVSPRRSRVPRGRWRTSSGPRCRPRSIRR